MHGSGQQGEKTNFNQPTTCLAHPDISPDDGKLTIRSSFGEIDISMAYTQSLSRENPGYIVILIDQSGSMSDPFGGTPGGSKAEECAKAVNRVLREIGLACTVGQEIRNRCDISILSYGASGNEAGNAFSGSLASKQVVTLQELAQNCVRVETVKMKVSDGAGGLVEVEDQFPIWVEPRAIGGTPMSASFEMAYNLVDTWTKTHQASFPPIVINITDGAPDSQSDAQSAALKLSQIGTSDGNTLILNIHISEGRAARVELPSSPSELPPGNGNAKFLFDISSELPPVMSERAGAVGYKPTAGARGFVYNADGETMIRLLDIGTRAKLR